MSSPNVTSSKAKEFSLPDRSGQITRPGLERIVVHHAAGMPQGISPSKELSSRLYYDWRLKNA